MGDGHPHCNGSLCYHMTAENMGDIRTRDTSGLRQ